MIDKMTVVSVEHVIRGVCVCVCVLVNAVGRRSTSELAAGSSDGSTLSTA